MRNASSLPCELVYAEEVLTDAVSFATVFHKYFSLVFAVQDELTIDLSDCDLNTIQFDQQTVEEALEKSSDGVGPGGVPGELLRTVAVHLSVHVCGLFRSILNGLLPANMEDLTHHAEFQSRQET